MTDENAHSRSAPRRCRSVAHFSVSRNVSGVQVLIPIRGGRAAAQAASSAFADRARGPERPLHRISRR
jgi:hypothetical protein